ncbi:MAG TPA: IclR family transcriptional regulator [Alphaproteobacteria bacterium]|nr:IclR family transcriptional regulator [Alphaproteobacteria bacterium]
MGRKDRQFVDALARGLGILEAFSRSSRPLSNGEIAQMARLAPSTVSRLTHTLTVLGYLRFDRNVRRYILTPKNLTLGYPVLAGLSLLDRARPVLDRLAGETGESAALAILDGLHATFVEVVHGSNLVAVRLATGARLPIALSAAGLSLLAGLPEAERRALAIRVRADLTQRGGDLDAFDRRLAQACEERVAVVRDAWRRGIGGVAIALKQQDQIVSLTIPVATGSISEEDMRGRLATMLVEASHYLAADGAPPVARTSERRSAQRVS